MRYIDSTDLHKTLKKRSTDAHKGDFGKLLIYAGSIGMAGAAVLNGRSALKSGVGLCQYLLPDITGPLLNILQISVPEATCVEIPNPEQLHSYSAISAGSGLGKGTRQQEILSYILDNYSGSLILDADALNMISESIELADAVRACKASVILTPHVGEAKRLLHSCAGIEGFSARKDAVCALTQEYNAIAVLKGAGTLTARYLPNQSPHFEICQNTSGNPGMATAGSGDCLAGVIASLAAQGYAPFDAALMGVYIHGAAGDLAASKLGEIGMTASDIVSSIPYVL